MNDKRLSTATGRKKIFRMVIPGYPSFNIYSSVARNTTALGPIIVATAVSKLDGWEVEVIDENNYRRGPRAKDGYPDHVALEALRPADMVGFYGGLTSTVPRLYTLARFYHERGKITVAGGQHFIDENIREALDGGVDYLALGEGERTIKELIQTLERGAELEAVAGLAFLDADKVVHTAQREPINDLEALPLPDFSLLRFAKVFLYPVGWSRGCGMKCEFCTVRAVVRCPPPAYVFEQIVSLSERRRATDFFIVDDLFGQRRELAIELCGMLKRYQETMGAKFHITAQIRLDKSKDLELLHAMRAANIRVVAIGFESPIPAELEAMNKKLRPEDMVAMTKVFHQAGILVHGMFIFGYPAQEGSAFHMPAKERVKAFWKFIRQTHMDTVQVLLPVPLPGTELTKRLGDAKRLFPREEIGWEYYDGNFPLFIPDAPLTADDQRAALRSLMGRFYNFWHFFSIGLNVLLFPTILFPAFNLKRGWHRWHTSWRNDLWGFVGWIIIRKWRSKSTSELFSTKLARATRTGTSNNAH